MGKRNSRWATNVLGGVSAITEYSPVITWARGADRMAFTYYENSDYTVWAVDNPRGLKTVAFEPRPAVNTGLTLNAPAALQPVAPAPAVIDTSHAAGGPTSVPARPMGCVSFERSRNAAYCSSAMPLRRWRLVTTTPGLTAFTRTPLAASSNAAQRVS